MSTDPPAATTAALCTQCVHDIQRRLDELPHLLVALRIYLGVTPKSAMRSQVRFTPEPSCPIDPRVDELLTLTEEIMDRTCGARIADLAREGAREFPVWEGDEQIIRSMDGARRALDVRRVHDRVNAVVGLDRAKQKRYAPCPECGQSHLWNWVGDETVYCDSCDSSMSVDEYNIYCSELLEDC